jgi:serine/threonine-protein kinase RIO1
LQDAIDRGWLRDGPGGDVSLIKVVVTAAEIAAGMFTLHKADVTHGDLSPYNVLLNG